MVYDGAGVQAAAYDLKGCLPAAVRLPAPDVTATLDCSAHGEFEDVRDLEAVAMPGPEALPATGREHHGQVGNPGRGHVDTSVLRVSAANEVTAVRDTQRDRYDRVGKLLQMSSGRVGGGCSGWFGRLSVKSRSRIRPRRRHLLGRSSCALRATPSSTLNRRSENTEGAAGGPATASPWLQPGRSSQDGGRSRTPASVAISSKTEDEA